MALKIIIDGYNLLMASDRFRRDFIDSFEETRNSFVKNVYSRRGEKADEVIKRMVENGEASTIVTSDREVADFVSRHGSVVISSGEFDESLMMAEIAIVKGEFEEDDYEKNITTKKRGNPKRLPKSERKKLQRLKKL